MAQAQLTKPMEDVNQVVDNTLDSLSKARTARIPAGTSRKGDHPVLFLIGNSMGKTHDEKVLRIFFPERFED